MKNIISKVAILSVLAFGIFFVASDNANAASSLGNCQACVEIDSECVLYCENGQNSPGCSWCLKRSERCWSVCRW